MSSDKFTDILTKDDLKGLRTYVLGKNELKAPRELSDEEKDRIAFRRKAGWSWFNPILDNEKRDVVQHIQNPAYRAALDVAGSSLPGAIFSGIYGAMTNNIMEEQLRHMPAVFRKKLLAKPFYKNPAVFLPALSAIPALLGTANRYKKQKLYNDIVEEYVKNHNEGAIESMPTVLSAMLEKSKRVSSLKLPKKKVKEASLPSMSWDNADMLKWSKRVQEVQKATQVFQGAIGGLNLVGGLLENHILKKEYNDIKERFERKRKNKAEAQEFITKVRMPLYRKGLSEDDKIRDFDKLFKSSADKSPLLPHQQRILEKLEKEDQPGLILMHGLGSGKTRSSIEAYKKLGLPAEVLLPAALKGNYEKELKKWVGKSPKDVNIRSQQDVARKGINPEDFKNKLMIIDEAHRLRNENTKLYKTLKDVSPSKRVLLTGTPIYNHPSDIAKLINLAAGKNIMPERQPEFEKEYIGTKTVFPSIAHRILGVKPGQELHVKNKEYLRKVFHKLIDYHAGNAEGFPEVSKEVVKVPMHEKQQQIYKALMKDLPWHLRAKVSAGLPPDRKELDKLIPFLSGARMISNSTLGFDKDNENVVSPKIEKAFNYFKDQLATDPEYKGLIYSNYLQSGVEPYKKLLQQANIPFGEFTGDINDKVRNQLVKDYNDNKLRALIVSSAGGEGLDLKGTRLVQLLEPHFNNEKIKQVIGRAARYKSHEALSPEKRNVMIQHYLSSLNPSTLEKLMRKSPTSTDEYLQNLADEKEKLNNEFVKLIKD
jgi:SNF2 family DNA or RNA helicase